MQDNVPHDLSASLYLGDVVDALPIAYPVEGMRGSILGVLKKVFTKASLWLEVKAIRRSALPLRLSRP